MDQSTEDRNEDSPASEDASGSRSSGGLEDWNKAFREVAPYLDLGWRLAATAAVPPLLGYGIDVWIHTFPWGILLGCGVALAATVVLLKQIGDELQRRSASNSEATPDT